MIVLETRYLPAFKSHYPRGTLFTSFLGYLRLVPPRLSLLFYLFRLSTPFWRLAQISRQFTLCALRRFPPSRFHPERRSHPNGSGYRLIRLQTALSPLRCSYGARTRTTVHTVHVQRAANLCGSFYRWATPGGVEALLHLFRANSPLKTAYTPSPDHPHPPANQLAFFLTCREAVRVKRLRVNSVKEGL